MSQLPTTTTQAELPVRRESDGLTEAEGQIMADLSAAWAIFAHLPHQYPADLTEAAMHIHALQHLILVRQVRDRYPQAFVNHTMPYRPGCDWGAVCNEARREQAALATIAAKVEAKPEAPGGTP